MSDDALLKSVFHLVAERVQDRGGDSLLNVARFLKSGIEGWLKVETARALGDRITKFQNNGPDLKLANGLFIELKGATDCNASWILSGLKYPSDQYPQLACLFLGSGKNISTSVDRLSREATIIDYARFPVGAEEWDYRLHRPLRFFTKEAQRTQENNAQRVFLHVLCASLAVPS
jgi:hypothetical protein